MGKQRASNGHLEPYRIKFWGIGNEMWEITCQYGAMKLNQFGFKHNQFAKAMNKVDPNISNFPVDALPASLTLPRFSVDIFELPVR